MNTFERSPAIIRLAFQGELQTTQWVLERKLYINSCACCSMIRVGVTSTGYTQEIAFKSRSLFLVFKNNLYQHYPCNILCNCRNLNLGSNKKIDKHKIKGKCINLV